MTTETWIMIFATAWFVLALASSLLGRDQPASSPLPGTTAMFGIRRQEGSCPTYGHVGERFLWRYDKNSPWYLCTVDRAGIVHRTPIDTDRLEQPDDKG